MEKLKPCPFCGGAGKVKAAEKDDVGLIVWCACESCNARTGGYCPNIRHEDSAIENIDYCKSKAIEAWNRRRKRHVNVSEKDHTEEAADPSSAEHPWEQVGQMLSMRVKNRGD